MSDGILIKRLETPEIDQVSRFRLGDESDRTLERFIRRDALKSGRANLTQTYVAKREGEIPIIGYISLMCAEIAFELSYSIADKAGADRYAFQPAVRIARLGVDAAHQGEGIGRMLVTAAVGLAQGVIQPAVGCRFIVLDAKPKSVTFYERIGFRILNTQKNAESATPLMFLDLQGLD